MHPAPAPTPDVTRPGAAASPGGGDGHEAGPVRGLEHAKQRVYRLGCVLLAAACGIGGLSQLVQRGPVLGLLVDLPLVGLCCWAHRVLRDAGQVRTVERLAVAALTVHLLLADVVDLVTRRPAGGLDVAVTSPFLLVVCVLCCLTMSPRAAAQWTASLWLLHAGLTWLGLFRSPWNGAQGTELGRDLVTLVGIALVTLLNRYHSVARASLASNRDLRLMALTDELTGLPNRRAMYNHLALRDGDLAVVMVDLDHFKRVNDTAGHDRGDDVLREIAAVLDDESAAEGVAGRWGGEEFVVVLDDSTLGRANLLAERLRARVQARDDLEGVTLSVGVTWQRPGEAASRTLRRADELMYEAKHGGRNRVCARG